MLYFRSGIFTNFLYQIYKSISEAYRKILHKEGIRGFYKGMSPSLAQIVPTTAIQFATYNKLKTLFTVSVVSTIILIIVSYKSMHMTNYVSIARRSNAANALWGHCRSRRKISGVAIRRVEEAITGKSERLVYLIMSPNTSYCVDPRTEARSQATSPSQGRAHDKTHHPNWGSSCVLQRHGAVHRESYRADSPWFHTLRTDQIRVWALEEVISLQRQWTRSRYFSPWPAKISLLPCTI